MGRLYHLFKHWPLRRGHQSPLCSLEGYSHLLRLRRNRCINSRHLGPIPRPAIPPVPLLDDGWMVHRCITPRAPLSLGSATASLFAVAHIGQLHESPFGEPRSEDLIFLYKTVPAQSIISRGFGHAKESRWRICLLSPIFLHFRAYYDLESPVWNAGSRTPLSHKVVSSTFSKHSDVHFTIDFLDATAALTSVSAAHYDFYVKDTHRSTERLAVLTAPPSNRPSFFLGSTPTHPQKTHSNNKFFARYQQHDNPRHPYHLLAVRCYRQHSQRPSHGHLSGSSPQQHHDGGSRLPFSLHRRRRRKDERHRTTSLCHSCHSLQASRIP